ncbi:Lipoamide acyltransferase [Tetrabaena socialis]|uniref:Lipoamide acyltransferase n=1 Tax=Tetrabaena socialis TaxID=47790 RepID=A0A2J8AD61_9CHLO|nr:Lipoamide acyltransferase [Tetrabaena socialis]|eukprot:PNH10452.1 Lipoamide acyltransferase [Tetrabaena socialis]
MRRGLPLLKLSAFPYTGALLGSQNVALGLAHELPRFPLPARLYAKRVQFPLAQTGEGISECELVAWAVKVQSKSVAAIAAELATLQQLAAAGRLPAEALAGGTISVSNIGTIGGTYATPLVLPRYPEQPRHGPGANTQLPVPVSLMPVSWGADHRVVDGAALAAFSNTWKALLESPERLLLTLS